MQSAFFDLIEKGAVIKFSSSEPSTPEQIIIDLELDGNVTRHEIELSIDADCDEYGRYRDMTEILSVDGVEITPDVRSLAKEVYCELMLD